MKLTWHHDGSTAVGRDANGRVRFTVERSKHGWRLCRWAEIQGEVCYRSHEFVHTRAGGIQYGNNLAKNLKEPS